MLGKLGLKRTNFSPKLCKLLLGCCFLALNSRGLWFCFLIFFLLRFLGCAYYSNGYQRKTEKQNVTNGAFQNYLSIS